MEAKVVRQTNRNVRKVIKVNGSMCLTSTPGNFCASM